MEREFRWCDRFVGADDHPGTMLTLQPGEWARIIGRGRLSEDFLPLIRNGDVVSNANARVSIYRNETVLSASASATMSQGVCLNQSQGPTVAVRVRGTQ